jgi:hypothetical protein
MSNRRENAGELHGTAKLKVPEVIAIRELARSGLTQPALGSTFGVSHSNVGYVVRREEWRKLLRKSAIGRSRVRIQAK